MKIKICGLKCFNDIKYVNETDIDYAGFIFVPTSKRYVDFNLASEMKKILKKTIKSVGVYVNENPETVKNHCDNGIIDIIQLHGSENNEYIKELKKITGKEIIKAYKADKSLERNIKESEADYILIDSSEGKNFGGTGNTFNWDMIPKTDKKIFLAGGLNENNVRSAIKINPYCLDINSGVETNGKKDENKIKNIVKIIRETLKESEGTGNEQH